MATNEVPPQVQELVTRVVALVRRELGSGVRLWWFGSWVKGTAVPRSDIDVAFDAGAPLAPARMGRLLAALGEIETLYHIDLVDLQGVGSRLRGQVLTEGVEL